MTSINRIDFESYLWKPLRRMRLSSEHRAVILEVIRRQDPDAKVILFGSRADDLARGGDIDLLVLSDKIGFRGELRIRREILDAIGWQKLDLIVRHSNQAESAIVAMAMENGVRL